MLQDIKFGLRTLTRTPEFSALAALTLALGIGASTAIFSIVNAVLLRRLPYTASDRLVAVQPVTRDGARFRIRAVMPGDFLDWQARSRSFDDMAAYTAATFALTGGGEPQRVLGAAVTQRFFETVGVQPIAGTTFASAGVDRTDVVVIGAGLWRRRFQSDPHIIGKTITIDGKPVAVVGVMPPGFAFPRDLLGGQSSGTRLVEDIGMWTPLSLVPGDRRNAYLQVIGRLKNDSTIERAQADITAIGQGLVAARVPRAVAQVAVVGLQEELVREVRPLLLVLFGAVGFLLLIACANVANLLVGRAASRQREVAIRVSLGAGRLRLVRQFLTESVMLALAGGVVGMLVAAWSLDLAVAIIPAGSLPRLSEVVIDRQALAFAIAVSVATGILFGLVPAIHGSKADVTDALKSAGSAQTVRTRLLGVIVVSEVTLAFVLVTASALLIKSFVRLTAVDIGFQSDRVLTASVTLPDSRYPSPPQIRAFSSEVIERLRRSPGVAHAGAINWVPFGGNLLVGDFIARDLAAMPPNAWAMKMAVSGDYFQAMAVPVARGRLIADADGADATPVAVVNEALASRIWPGQNAVGKEIRLGFGQPPADVWRTIVGVVGNTKQAFDDEVRPAIYVPVAQLSVPILLRNLTFVARAASTPASLVPAIRSDIRSADPLLPFDRIQTMEELQATSVSEPRFRSVVLATFAATALALVAIGILGVLAYTVTRRTREIGVRMALGAQRVDVVGLVVRQALGMTAIGVIIGAIAAAWLVRLLERFLFGVRALDAPSFIAAAIVLVGVALVASYVPARRATKLDPLIALRAE